MDLDPVLLSRIQFAWVIAWHILLPAFTVGLASYIALLEGLHLATGRDVYVRVSIFWTRIFSIAFGMGVVTGIVMPFQLGTNWSTFSDATANVLSPLFAYEGLTAFFLEAAFLGVLLFGRKLVPPWAHFIAALMVALGTLFSSFWILAANSWMQTPAGYELVDGLFHPTDWLQVIFNPSFPYRLAHTVCGFFVTTGFVVAGVGALYLRQGRFFEEARVMLSMTLWLLTVLVPLQILIGDLHGLNTREHQPAKLAAMEAHWETGTRVPLILFAIPDQAAERNRFVIEVPLLGSLILAHADRRRGAGAEGLPARGPRPGDLAVLRLPDHAGDRHAHARHGRLGRLAALARRPLRQPGLPARDAALHAARLRGGAGGLDHHRGRAPALDRLRPAPDRAFGDAVAHRL